MRILIVSPFYPPQLAIAARRVHAHAVTWAEHGEDVTVLTCSKREDQQGAPVSSPGVCVEEVSHTAPAIVRWARRKSGERGLRSADDAASPGWLGRELIRLRKRTGVFSGIRMPDITDAWVTPAVQRGVELGREQRFDVVVASSGPYTALRVADRLHREEVAGRFVAEFRDLWTANHSASGVFPFTIRERAIERRVLDRADLLVTVSEGLAGWLRANSQASVEVIYNGHAGQRSCDASPLGCKETTRIVYTGAVYERGHDLRPLMEGLAVLCTRDKSSYERVRLVVAGPSGEVFRSAAHAAGVEDRIELLGIVSASEAIKIQDEADGLLSIEWSAVDSGILTGKLFEYLAGRPPILVIGRRREITDLVISCGRGIHAGADPGSIADSMTQLVRGTIAAELRPDHAMIDSLSRKQQSLRLLQRLYGVMDD